MAPQTLTDYERRRLENIKRNNEMVASLKLHSKANQLSSPSIKRPRIEIKGYKPPAEKKPKDQSPIIIRRSLRTRGIEPDASTANGVEDDLGPSPQKPPISSHPNSPPIVNRGPITMREANVGGSSDRQFIDSITDMSDHAPLSCSKARGGGNGDFGPLDLKSFTLRQENVARVVPARIFSVQFFPALDRTVIVAGDKRGNVGFWDVDCEEGNGDGVYVYQPHSAPVSSISIQPFSLSKIVTSGYDGLIRLMDVEEEKFDVVYFGGDAIFSLSQRPHDMKSLFFGEAQGVFKAWDERAGKISSSYILHNQRINSIDFNPENHNLMATSSTDGTACIWDLRSNNGKRPKSLRTIEHKRAVHSAYFSPSGSYLATTSPDDKVGLLTSANFEDMCMIHHNNQTSRWISSFRAIWGWDDSYLFIGNTKRAVDVISTDYKMASSLESPYMTAIPCRFAAHPFKVGNLAGATGGGQVYMWTTS